MPLDVWSQDDLKRILTALAGTVGRYSDPQFKAGYEAAIGDIARAFGVVIVCETAPVQTIEAAWTRR